MSSTANAIQQHVEVVQDDNGPRARIVGTRMRVRDIAVWHEQFGWSADEIVKQFPHLTMADVYAALAYYWDNRDAIREEIASDNARVEEFFRDYETPLDRKLKEMRKSHVG